jgi:putative membrane protein
MFGLQPLPVGWAFEPSVIAGIVVGVVLYPLLVPRETWFRGRAWLYWLGILAFFIGLVSPVDSIADRYLLSMHMVQHILITMVGPALVLGGLPDSVSQRLRLSRFLVNPWLAVTLFNVVLMVWHFPSLYEATLEHEALHIFEHLMFVATAFLFWWPVVGPGSRGERRMSPLMRIGYLAFAGVPPTVIGITLAFIPGVLYPFYERAPRLFGDISASLDQQLAGILMFGIGNLIYFVPITRNFMRLMEEQEAQAETDGAVSL